MKILYISSALYSNNGSVVHAKEFLSALRDVAPVGSVIDTLEERMFKDSKFYRFLVLIPVVGDIIRKQFDNNILKENYDLIIIRNFYDIRLPIRLKKAKPKTKIYIEFNDFVFIDRFKGLSFINKYLANKELDAIKASNKVFPISETLKEKLAYNGLEIRNLIVNHNGVDLNKFDKSKYQVSDIRRQYDIPSDAIVICYTGSVTKAKKLDVIISVLADIADKIGPKAFFLIACNGSKGDYIDNLLEQFLLGVMPYKRFTWLPHDSVPALLAITNVALFPFTTPYMSPLKLFEYLAMEIPTIGPKTAAVEEVFKSGEHLILVKDSTELQSAIIALCNNYHDYSQSIAVRGRRLVKDNYSWKSNAKKVLDTYTREIQ